MVESEELDAVSLLSLLTRIRRSLSILQEEMKLGNVTRRCTGRLRGDNPVVEVCWRRIRRTNRWVVKYSISGG